MDDDTRRQHRAEIVVAAQAGDAVAREELVRSFLPLIAGVARNYRYTRAVDRGELIQEGVVGLLRALERYDPALGTPFWGYAAWWVRQAMQRLVAELSGPIVLSDRALRQLAQLRDTRSAFMRAHSREPSIQELASAAGVETEQVHGLLGAERPARGLEEAVADEDTSAPRFGDFVADPRSEDAYDDAVWRLGAEQLPALLDCLNERERMVIRARYGLGEQPRTLRELAVALGLSGERVRQIEQCAIERMRDMADATGAHMPAAATAEPRPA